MVTINYERLSFLAQALARIPLPPDFRQRFVPLMTAETETARLALLWVAAICHSTKGGLLGRSQGREVKGSEYLLAAFCGAANQEPQLLSIANMKKLDASTLRHLLEAFIESPVVTLVDLDRRAEILRHLAGEIDSLWQGRISSLLEKAAHHVGGERGFYAQMDCFSAFRDPLKKKSGVFLYFLEVSGQWSITDADQLLPMVDYHIIRLLCRTGCLEIQRADVRQKLFTKQPVTEDEERCIREAAFQIRLELAKTFDVPERGELLYLLGRSYCRYTPVCVNGALPESDSFNVYTKTAFQGRCPLQDRCPGACDGSYRGLWEPIIQTENY